MQLAVFTYSTKLTKVKVIPGKLYCDDSPTAGICCVTVGNMATTKCPSAPLKVAEMSSCLQSTGRLVPVPAMVAL